MRRIIRPPKIRDLESIGYTIMDDPDGWVVSRQLKAHRDWMRHSLEIERVLDVTLLPARTLIAHGIYVTHVPYYLVKSGDNTKRK